MRSEFNLGAYFDRIGYGGPASPTLDTLQAIHGLHPQAIAFENLNPLLHWPVQLDAQSLQAKLVAQGRGGYCYEHNLLLKHALDTIGFRVAGLAARVLWNSADDAIRPRTHMLLLVDLNGEQWIADVGFGGLTLTAPLRLVVNEAQTTPHEPFRLIRVDDDYALQAGVRGDWRTLYRFDLQPQFLPDYELASWYLCHHPESRFVNHLVVARVHPQRRYALFNNELAIHELQGDTVRRKLASAAELLGVLEETFGIVLPESAELRTKLAQVAGTP
jgi:N-hydroxyarylamine O-acetyltransferase